MFLQYPVDFVGITQYYSTRHPALDLGWESNPNTHPILAAGDGTVVRCGTEVGTGAIFAVLRHTLPDGFYYTLYWHLRSLEIEQGQTVKRGQRIGMMGRSGNANGVHLHFEVWKTPGSYTNWRIADKSRYALDPRRVTYLYPAQRKSSGSQGVKTLPQTPSLTLNNEPLYAASTSSTPAARITGVYYRWDDDVVRGRIRITNAPERIGVAGQVTGWIAAPAD